MWMLEKSAGDEVTFVAVYVDSETGHSYEYAHTLANEVTKAMIATQHGTKAEVATVGESKDIVVTINHGLDEYDIEFIQQIESAIDEALSPLGFARSTTEKGENIKLVYFQFGQHPSKG